MSNIERKFLCKRVCYGNGEIHSKVIKCKTWSCLCVNILSFFYTRHFQNMSRQNLHSFVRPTRELVLTARRDGFDLQIFASCTSGVPTFS